MMTTWMPGYYNSLVKGYSSQHAQTIGPLGSFWSFGSQLGIMIFMGFLGLIPGPGPAIGSGCCARVVVVCGGVRTNVIGVKVLLTMNNA